MSNVDKVKGDLAAIVGQIKTEAAAALKVARKELAAFRQKMEDEMADKSEEEESGTFETPQNKSEPGPTYPHPEGTNNPVDPAEQQDKFDHKK